MVLDRELEASRPPIYRRYGFNCSLARLCRWSGRATLTLGETHVIVAGRWRALSPCCVMRVFLRAFGLRADISE
jgi:hypothetical protein